MVRGRRNRDKLQGYYDLFMNTGQLDPNLNPEIAASWQESRRLGAASDKINIANRVSAGDFADRLNKHSGTIAYLQQLTSNLRDFFKEYDISLLLLDEECVILKSYTMPFYQLTPGEIEGVRAGVADIGTSSVSIAYEKQMPFWVFGPEMWVQESHESDACSAPIMVGGKVQYIVTMVGMHYQNMPQEAVMAVLKSIVYGLQNYVNQQESMAVQEKLLSVVPFALYQVREDSQVIYANQLGRQRLQEIGITPSAEGDFNDKLQDVVLNYAHTPIAACFKGRDCHNEEVTWITGRKTYEDITTVTPFARDKAGQVSSVIVVSMPIEDLRTMVAHAVGFTARYSLSSLVCIGSNSSAIKSKALRVAKGNAPVLLVGEAGTGKQRVAHGIHLASDYANGAFITFKCHDAALNVLQEELFGITEGEAVSKPGKLELAEGGTLFIDEIEKMPWELAEELAEAIRESTVRRVGEKSRRRFSARIIAASDTELRRLTEKKLFPVELYNLIARSVIRIPPLRQRRADIKGLAEHILRELAEMHHVPGKSLSREAAELLCSYHWPGNIKQLQGIMENTFFKADSQVIRAKDIDITGVADMRNRWKADKEVFSKLWQAAGENVSRMAASLSVSRVTLYRYLEKYGIKK